ncbi:MAG: serine hydrolase [Deltaproteobacteria bacterium]|nr:serine hydrolase [Deltaproteobacteria bacterium]
MSVKHNADGVDVKSLMREGLMGRVFPGAAALVALRGEIVFFEYLGQRSLIPEPLPMLRDTVFDLASLTKPLATALCIMKLVDRGEIFLDQSLADVIAHSDLREKGKLSFRSLLSHSAGLADWKPYYEKLMDHPPEARKRLLREWIVDEPFAYEPGKENVYSDLGFMLLEWVIEEKTGLTIPQYAHDHLYEPLGLKRTFFRRTREERNAAWSLSAMPWNNHLRGNEITGLDGGAYGYTEEQFAATEDCPWRKRVLCGEVHDDNAWALGGYSGHAGLFSTAEEVLVIAAMLLDHFYGRRQDFFRPETVREFFRRQGIVKGSDWALGWDTRALEGSSAGKYFSRDSLGHTGFTGTSIWMDLDKDVIAILLTNRVHPTRNNERIKQFRPAFHDAVMEELGSASA